MNVHKHCNTEIKQLWRMLAALKWNGGNGQDKMGNEQDAKSLQMSRMQNSANKPKTSIKNKNQKKNTKVICRAKQKHKRS